MIAKDFFNKDLNIGDEVAFMQVGYRQLKSGFVEKITEHFVFINHKKFNVGGILTKQKHGQVIKR